MNDAMIRTLFVHCRWYELALHRHGFTSERLMHLARKVAADGVRRRNAALGDRFDDLVSRLTTAGLEAALRFDPEREHRLYGRNGGDPFTSYVSDVMDKRIDDFFRRRSEGFADRRYATYGEVVPTGEIEQQRADVEDAIANMDTATVIGWYQAAADAEELPLQDWIVRALNERAGRSVHRPVLGRPRRKVKPLPDYWPGQQVEAVGVA